MRFMEYGGVEIQMAAQDVGATVVTRPAENPSESSDQNVLIDWMLEKKMRQSNGKITAIIDRAAKGLGKSKV